MKTRWVTMDEIILLVEQKHDGFRYLPHMRVTVEPSTYLKKRDARRLCRTVLKVALKKMRMST